VLIVNVKTVISAVELFVLYNKGSDDDNDDDMNTSYN